MHLKSAHLAKAIALLLATLGLIVGVTVSPSTAATYEVTCRSSGFACATGGYGSQNLGWPDNYYGQNWEAGLVHNCTRYAAFKLQQNGFGDPGSSFGNAYQWDDRVRSKFGADKVNGTPSVGAIAQWDSFPGDGGFGHVAYVEEVGTDYIRVTDDAYDGDTTSKIIPTGHARWPSNFIHLTGPPPSADRDGDGVPNTSDRCPDQPGPATTGGCPDTDGDTVADLDDACPYYPDRRDPHGCPGEGTSAGVSDFNGDGIGDVAGVYEYPGSNPSVRIHLFAGRRSGTITGPSVFWQTDGTWSGDRARFVSGFVVPAQDPVPPAPEPVPAAPTATCGTGMPALRVHASGANKRSKLHIDVDPDTVKGAVRVTVLKKRHGRWHHTKKLSLRRRDHQRTINLPGGKYRVTAPTQFGLCPSRSRTITLRR